MVSPPLVLEVWTDDVSVMCGKSSKGRDRKERESKVGYVEDDFTFARMSQRSSVGSENPSPDYEDRNKGHEE